MCKYWISAYSLRSCMKILTMYWNLCNLWLFLQTQWPQPTKGNQFPGLPGSKCFCGWCWWGPTNYFVNPNLSWGWIGLWQLNIEYYKTEKITGKGAGQLGQFTTMSQQIKVDFGCLGNCKDFTLLSCHYIAVG